MTLVYYILGSALLAFIISRGASFLSTENNIDNFEHTMYVKRSIFLFVIFWIIFSVLMGFRFGFVDTSTYKMMSERIGADFANLKDPSVGEIEIGFNIWMILCNIASNSNEQFFVFVTTSITLALVFSYLYKESTDGGFSILLFVTLYSFTFMNGIRQALAASFFALAYQKYKERPIIMVFICVLLSVFHNSMLLLIPLYLCSQGKFFNLKMKILFCFAVLCVIAPESIDGILNRILSERYMESLSAMDYGTGMMRIVINSLPVILMLLARRITRGKGVQNDDMDNLLVIDFLVNLCSIRSTYFARMSIYLGLFLCAYYPSILKKIFTKNSQRMLSILFTGFYMIFYFYQAHTFERYGYLREFYLTFMK
mgnify:CR=1 FL=1